MYKGPETIQWVALLRHHKHTRTLSVGEGVLQKAFSKEVTSKLKPEGQDGVIEKSIPEQKKSMGEVLEARKCKMSPGIANNLGQLEQRVEVRE